MANTLSSTTGWTFPTTTSTTAGTNMVNIAGNSSISSLPYGHGTFSLTNEYSLGNICTELHKESIKNSNDSDKAMFQIEVDYFNKYSYNARIREPNILEIGNKSSTVNIRFIKNQFGQLALQFIFDSEQDPFDKGTLLQYAINSAKAYSLSEYLSNCIITKNKNNQHLKQPNFGQPVDYSGIMYGNYFMTTNNLVNYAYPTLSLNYNSTVNNSQVTSKSHTILDNYKLHIYDFNIPTFNEYCVALLGGYNLYDHEIELLYNFKLKDFLVSFASHENLSETLFDVPDKASHLKAREQQIESIYNKLISFAAPILSDIDLDRRLSVMLLNLLYTNEKFTFNID